MEKCWLHGCKNKILWVVSVKGRWPTYYTCAEHLEDIVDCACAANYVRTVSVERYNKLREARRSGLEERVKSLELQGKAHKLWLGEHDARLTSLVDGLEDLLPAVRALTKRFDTYAANLASHILRGKEM